VAAIALFFYRRNFAPRVERPEINAIFKKVPPVADGAIGKDEYGPPVTIDGDEVPNDFGNSGATATG
jgi:hypothetical protein